MVQHSSVLQPTVNRNIINPLTGLDLVLTEIKKTPVNDTQMTPVRQHEYTLLLSCWVNRK